MTANNSFTAGQQVIVDGTLYTFKHYATAQGVPPRKAPHAHAPAHCSYAVVNLPGSSHPILVRRESLKTASDVAVDGMIAQTAKSAPLPTPPAPMKSAKSPTGLDIIKADALDMQAERLEGYAKSLRNEAAALRGAAW